MSHGELTVPLPTLADYVAFHRKRLKLTRAALGGRAHLAARTIQKLETGEQLSLTESSLNSLARALDLNHEDQRRHLDELTRVHKPRPWLPTELRFDATADERAMLDDLMPQPAAYCNESWTVVAANAAYRELFPGRVEAGNILLWQFSAIGRKTIVNWDTEVTGTVSRMRGILAHFGNPALGAVLLNELAKDPDFVEIWMRREVGFDRAVDEPQHIYTATGPVTVIMQLQSVAARLDRLHLCVGVVRPYSGPVELIKPQAD
ncbi:helix-turn-helix domain-containing protein [Nocardia sp. NPDC050712]|uniref:MmyB family transcriptional regulator n=1 Tax=Nocardia sp. NPDC050712 TaxID=3155518 RepID=UPI0033E548A8